MKAINPRKCLKYHKVPRAFEDLNPALYERVSIEFDEAQIHYSIASQLVKNVIQSKNVFPEFYLKVTSLKKVGIKVTIAIGGWNDSEGDKYSRLVNNPAARKKFVDHVVGFVEKYNFDGLDLDWEYPSCWQVRKLLF